MQPDDRESWYPDPPRRGIMGELYQHQALWNNRQSPRVYQAFSELLGMEKLWVSVDRVSLSPPERNPPVGIGNLHGDAASKPPIPMHWDYALQLHGDGKATLMNRIADPPMPFWVQGVLYLTDTPANSGAFVCVPGFHRNIDTWLENLPTVTDPRKRNKKNEKLFLNYENWLENLPPEADSLKQDFVSTGAKSVPAEAGDLIIWHSSLPHGTGYNTADYPRVVQYMTMFPAQEKDEYSRNHRIKVCDQMVNLSPLGQKLLGLDSWDNQ